MIGEIGEYLPGLRKPREFVCDTESDVASLPQCICGSTAIIIETGGVYIVDAQGRWVKFGT